MASLAWVAARGRRRTHGTRQSCRSPSARSSPSAKDIFRDFPQAPSSLSFANKAERRKILRYVYAGSPWVDLDAIEAEAAELMERDPQQAERFFGNRLVQGLGAWLPDKLWESTCST